MRVKTSSYSVILQKMKLSKGFMMPVEESKLMLFLEDLLVKASHMQDGEIQMIQEINCSENLLPLYEYLNLSSSSWKMYWVF